MTNWELASVRVRSIHAGASWIHDLLPQIDQEIWNGTYHDIRPAKQSRDIQDAWIEQMETNVGSKSCVSKVERGLQQCTHLEPFGTGKANYSADCCMLHRHSQHSQPVQHFRDFKTCQLLLSNILRCETWLQHLRLGTVGHRWAYATMVSLTCEREPHGPHTLRPSELQAHPTVNIALPAAD